MFHKHILLMAFLCIIGVLGCQKQPKPEPVVEAQVEPTSEAPTPKTRLQMTVKTDYPGPAHVKVQHILIGFDGSLPGKKVSRTQGEAEKLAKQLFERAKKEDFDVLVKKYTDDRVPGIYGMANKGVKPSDNEFPREQMVAAFGDVGFQLQVGEIGLATFDKKKSPFGYHIIKRLK